MLIFLPLNGKLYIILCFLQSASRVHIYLHLKICLLQFNIKSQTQSHITKQLLTSISVDIRIYQPSKVIITEAGRPPASVNNTFSG